MTNTNSKWEKIEADPREILKNRKIGRIYIGDFKNNFGRYVSTTIQSDDPIDAIFKISPRIELRLTYEFIKQKVIGLQISKVDSKGKYSIISLSKLDWESVQKLLYIFDNIDIKSVASNSLILDKSIIKDPEKIINFLNTLASDPKGKSKLDEFFKNYELIEKDDLDNLSRRKRAVQIFESILNSEEQFIMYKSKHKIGKDEEVWQRFFSENKWILGSDFINILPERKLDTENTTDYLIKSFDGFVDIIELKLPLKEFWTKDFIPVSKLTAATMQCNRYILQTEKNMSNMDFFNKIDNTPIAKPRITLIYGRSIDWNKEEKEAFRVLNASYSNLNIVTYDHLLERAKRIIDIKEEYIN